MRNIVLYLLLIQSFACCCAFVNFNQSASHSSNEILQNSKPHQWSNGVNCIVEYSLFWGPRTKKLTRSPNIIITASMNMSSPAAEIQEGFLKHLNDRINTDQKERHFQLRVISDAETYSNEYRLNNALVSVDSYVIVIDSVQRLQYLMRHYITRMSSWNPYATFFILYHDPKKHDAENSIAMEIFTELLHKYFIHFVALLYATSDDEYSFSIINYYNHRPCRTMGVTSIDTCHNGKASLSVDETIKALKQLQSQFNFKHCTLNLCASISKPFVEHDCNEGIELNIINSIREHLGFQLNQTCYWESRGIFDTKSSNWTGVLGHLNERSCDFILGGYFLDNDVWEHFWIAEYHYWSKFQWHFQLAAARSAWMGLYSIFESRTWLCYILMLILSWFFLYFVVNMLPEPRAHKELSLAGMNAFGMTINASINERPICNASRIFFLLLAIYGLIVSTVYTSKLIDVFKNPGFQHQIKSLDEAVAAGIPFGGNEESRVWFKNDDDMWIYNLYNDSANFKPSSKNLMAVTLGERIILSNSLYILQNNMSDHIYAFPSKVFVGALAMIMKPGFPFLNKFNTLISQMRDTGLFTKLHNDFMYNKTYLNRIAKRRPHFQESVIILTVDHLQSSFVWLFFGYTLATLAFLGELFMFHCFQFYRQRHGRVQRSENKPTNLTKLCVTKSKGNCKPVNRAEAKQKPKAYAAKYKIDFFKQPNVGDSDVNIGNPLRFTPVVRRRVLLK